MATIHRTTDRIKVKVQDITVSISPLTKLQKQTISMLFLKASKGDMEAAMASTFACVKASVKDVQGIKDFDGNEYRLEFENGELTDECVNDLLNMEESEMLQLVCTQFLTKIPKEIVSPLDGKPIEGIKILPRGKSGK
jgi:hypothetical protein